MDSCPIRFGADVFGDRWTLLILRDLAFKGRNSFNALLEAGEGIARNILSDRLKKLEAADLVERVAHPSDGRRKIYRLTEPGLDLIPVLLEIVVWSAEHDPATGVPAAFLAKARADRAGFIEELKNAARA